MPVLPLLCFLCAIPAVVGTNTDHKSCTVSEEQVEAQEQTEVGVVKQEMLQIHQSKETLKHAPDVSANRRYLLVRPCERFAGDGVSGLPRRRVTGECCGDSICSTARWESFDSCPQDCKDLASDESEQNQNTAKGQVEKDRLKLPPSQSSLFGTLNGLEHDEYHCQESYDDHNVLPCSPNPHRESKWLESLLERANNGTLPFDMPPKGSIAVEFGSGLGQDSRNMAKLAGFAVTAVEVSPSASEQARNYTPAEMLGSGAGQIEFVAYDAFALPAPKQRVDFFFDATVYCALRYTYLARDYAVWARIATPGHTLFNIQCWNKESDHYAVAPQTKRDMEADFEPIFDILHSESCEKNQGGAGWCFYMKMKAPEVRKQIFLERLKIQQAVRHGNLSYVQESLQERSGHISDRELATLYYIAQANQHTQLKTYLRARMPKSEDPFLELVYGEEASLETIQLEDQLDGGGLEVAYLKADWERAEAELLLSNKLEQLS